MQTHHALTCDTVRAPHVPSPLALLPRVGPSSASPLPLTPWRPGSLQAHSPHPSLLLDGLPPEDESPARSPFSSASRGCCSVRVTQQLLSVRVSHSRIHIHLTEPPNHVLTVVADTEHLPRVTSPVSTLHHSPNNPPWQPRFTEGHAARLHRTGEARRPGSHS